MLGCGADEATAGDVEQPALPYTVPGIGEKTVRRLVDGGFGTIEALAAATIEQLSEIPGIGEKTAGKILAAARGEGEAQTDEATIE